MASPDHLLLLFCRITIGLIFLFSVLGKIKNLAAFLQAVKSFEILPQRLVKAAAAVFICSEIAIFIAMLVGSGLLAVGFSVAAFILAVFCLALISVLRRRISTSCNCFGNNSKNKISVYDVWRNLILVLLSLCGWALISAGMSGHASSISFSDVLAVLPVSLATVILLINFGDVLQALSGLFTSNAKH